MAKTKSKPKQEELPGMPAGPHRDLLLECAEIMEEISEKKNREKELLDQIRSTMREEKAKQWTAEDVGGKKYIFKLKTTGERVVMARIKEKKKEF